MTSPKMRDTGRISMYGYATDTNGHRWKVTFTLIIGPKYSFPLMSALNTVTKDKYVIQRTGASNNAHLILDIWPIEYWPEFAKPLANAIVGKDGSIQEGFDFNV